MTQSLLHFALRGAESARKKVVAFDRAVEKNRSIAIRVELFRLRKQLLREIRKGAPGGAKYEPLSFAARASSKGLKSRKPFTQLFSTKGAPSPGKGVVPARYHEKRQGRTFELGFTDTRKERLSKSWKHIMRAQQAGFTRPITDRARKAWIRRGAAWKKRLGRNSRAKLASVFFLRKSTKSFRTKARPIIDPFWASNKQIAIQNFVKNFDKKMKGERI